jgi:hypothetical protein
VAADADDSLLMNNAHPHTDGMPMSLDSVSTGPICTRSINDLWLGVNPA